MPKPPHIIAIFCAILSSSVITADDYRVEFSTYLGGSLWEHARDVVADADGNIYIVGGTKSDNFPTTPGAFQRTHNKTGKKIGSGGYCDAFVCKFSPDGKLIWSTLLGGPNYDRAYAVEVDGSGFVYVSGRSGPGFPTTAGSFQPQFRGTDNGIYGMQNGFVARLKPDGSQVEWAAHVGVGQLCRDLSIDDKGDVYLALHYTGKGPLPPDEWFANAYQKRPAGDVEIGAIKIASDGSAVEWATWFGGSGREVPNCGVRLDADRNVFLNFTTQSADVPTTSDSHDQTYNGGNDAFVAKLSPDGSTLLYGTYFGGTGNEEGNSTHNLAVDSQGNAYLASSTDSTDLPVTNGVVQELHAGGQRDAFVAKFSPTGQLDRCTYIGGTGQDGPDGVYAATDGSVFLTGLTDSRDFPVTSNAIQSKLAAPKDALMVVLSPEFDRLQFSTLFGGSSYDDGRSCFLDERGNLYVTGSTNGPGWPTTNAWQNEFAGGGGGKELCYQGGCFAGDVILVKLVRE